ncbi:putative Late nodulin [Medicago truncatula]|uniref:Nodule Cysteine-Rich (NCR) secreted peptide n=1 Tax=Medicago truncatula TaxID=3880 RepID=G7KI57_MEDTR|nr:Nodule Cysteine-Rich (NCR) secreted peptide [Medicago truncatula]RHN49798.1 putative Late nodulin [Medicago truncatula]
MDAILKFVYTLILYLFLLYVVPFHRCEKDEDCAHAQMAQCVLTNCICY